MKARRLPTPVAATAFTFLIIFGSPNRAEAHGGAWGAGGGALRRH
jgi:hypothetical protein